MKDGLRVALRSNVQLRGAVVRHVVLLSLHHAVLGPHSGRLQ